jgi:hypothetical protein
MVMIDMYVMLNHTSMYDTHIQLKISLPGIPQKGNELFLGQEHREEFGKIIIEIKSVYFRSRKACL